MVRMDSGHPDFMKAFRIYNRFKDNNQQLEA
jgi:hypothetical protein